MSKTNQSPGGQIPAGDKPDSLLALAAALEKLDLAQADRLIDLWEVLLELLEADTAGAERPPAARRMLEDASERIETVVLGAAADAAGAIAASARLLRACTETSGAALIPFSDDAADLAGAAQEAPAPQAEPASLCGSTLPPLSTDSRRQPVFVASNPELLSEFAHESQGNLDDAELALLNLESDPANSALIDTIFRAFHTIKGVAAFLELDPIRDLAHSAESLLSRVREGEIQCTGGYATFALRAVDGLRSLITALETGGSADAKFAIPAEYDQLIATLDAPESYGINAAAIQPEAAAAETAELQVEPFRAAKTAEVFTRIRTDRLDRLLDTVGELVIAQSMLAEDEGLGAGDQLESRKVNHAGKIVRELQDLSLLLRMVPLKATFQRMERVIRDMAHKCGKRVKLVSSGEDTEIDRNMVDVLAEPLVHMVRNACDHGLEPPEERLIAGKTEIGTVYLSAFHQGGYVVVELRDDGRGLDRDKILARAQSTGLVPKDSRPSDEEIYTLIFAPGFSTATHITNVSGRGVGMDVVQQGLHQLKGRIFIRSTPGDGTTFAIHVPLTLAITDGMLVRVGAERYIIPTVSISLSFRPENAAISTVSGRGELVVLRARPIPMLRLHRLFDIEGAIENPSEGLLVVIGDAGDRTALLVDELLGQYQVVTKSLGLAVDPVPGVSGGAILCDGRVGLILDPSALTSMATGSDRDLCTRGETA